MMLRPQFCATASRLLSLMLPIAAALATLNGCGHLPIPTESGGSASLAGIVHGGQQPISGATIQLYTVGTSGNGSVSKPLLTSTVLTDATGGFTITNAFTCPSPSAQVYLVGLGGNPGLASGTNNQSIAMMATLGPCSSLTSSRFISMNELTTIASVVALAPYMTSYSAIGYNTTSQTAFLNAVNTVSEYVDTASGSVPGPSLPAGYYASSYEINTLANVVASCINSYGGFSNDGSLCGSLFALSKPNAGAAPTETLGAILQIILNPTYNTSAIYNLVGPVPPFQPQVSTPAAWTFPILPMATTPTISPAGGGSGCSFTISITDPFPGAIHYTVDGSIPTASSPVYTSSFSVTSTTTVRAIEVPTLTSAYGNSSVASATYTIIPPVAAATPTISPAAGTYSSSLLVTLTDATPNASIYYTTDGSTPTTASTLYTAPFNVTGFETVQAVAFASGCGLPSAVASASYTGNYFGVVSTVAGTGTVSYVENGDGNLATSASLNAPGSVVADSAGNFYFINLNRIRKVDTSGIITLFAGNGTSTSSGDGGPATSAGLNPTVLAIDSANNLYVSETANYRVRKITADGTISTYAGTGTRGYTGDGGQAASATLNAPSGLGFDGSGNLYLSDGGNQAVRKVTPAGIISTYAASISTPNMIVAPNGTLYFTGTNIIQKLAPGGAVSTVAGTGAANLDGNDGAMANNSGITGPGSLALDSTGNLYFAQSNNYGSTLSRIRQIDTQGRVYTVAGTSTQGYSGDGGPATIAQLYVPGGLTVDSSGNLYFADGGNARVRKVTYQPFALRTTAPTFSQPTGSYPSGTFITIAGPTGSTIYYTTDGSTPTTSSSVYSTGQGFQLIYTHPDLTLKAIAVVPGYAASAITTGVFTATKATEPVPVFAVKTYTGDGYQRVQVPSTNFYGGTIRYTLDGSTPNSSSAVWNSAWNSGNTGTNAYFQVSVYNGASTTLKAYRDGTVDNQYDSPVVTLLLTAPAAPLPYFIIAPGTYTTLRNPDLYLMAEVANADVYYTLDGSTPTKTTAIMGAPKLFVEGTVTIKVIAGGGYYADSPVLTGTYTITGPLSAPTIAVGNNLPPFSTPQTVTIASATGPKVYYTLDGSTPTTASTLYTGPFTLSANATVKAIEACPGYANSTVATVNATFALPAPTFTPVAGTYPSTPQSVTITAASGASIYYTLDGSTPTTGSTLYIGPISVASNTTIQAMAYNATYGYVSPVASASYSFSVPPPTFSLASGSYGSTIPVSITTGTLGASIYYTLDGSTPTTSSTLYTGTLTVSTTETIKAIAAKPGFLNSTVATASYTIAP